MSVIRISKWSSQMLVLKNPGRIFKWRLFSAMTLIFFNVNVFGQQNLLEPYVQLQSMTIDELKSFNEEIIRTHPRANCLAWLAFDGKKITTPLAIYDLWNGGSVMKINNKFVYSSEGTTVDSMQIIDDKSPVPFRFLQNLSFVENFYNKGKSSLLQNGHVFSVRTKNLKLDSKKKKCTFANAQCRKYVGDFSLSVSSLNESTYRLLTEMPVGRLMIEDMCPVARGNGARNSPLRELSGLVEQSNLGRSSEKDYLNDLAANGIRQSWLKPYITLQEALK